ncbi:hypothetical protein GEV33_006461 [Tenebrio molitor]|uniref:Uncharacterized protein n=1 Tax=Tenebrio molitor TaxID=7067 RepID=A0A8J6HKJ9_TENMO|nr:hypothetical protein GEV33_006461 [Tenebrio molitor]
MRSLLFVRAGLGESEINFLDADLTDHRGFLFGTKKFLRRDRDATKSGKFREAGPSFSSSGKIREIRKIAFPADLEILHHPQLTNTLARHTSAHGGRAATGGAFSPKRASRFYRNVEVGPRPSHGLHYVKPISCTVTRRLFEAPDGVDALALDCVRVVQEVFWVAVAGKKICAIKRRHGCDFENYVRSGTMDDRFDQAEGERTREEVGVSGKDRQRAGRDGRWRGGRRF